MARYGRIESLVVGSAWTDDTGNLQSYGTMTVQFVGMVYDQSDKERLVELMRRRAMSRAEKTFADLVPAPCDPIAVGTMTLVVVLAILRHS